MEITISWGPLDLHSRASNIARPVATLTLPGIPPTGADGLEPQIENEAELRALAQAAQQSVERTVKKLDETIAYVSRSLRPRRKTK